MPCALAISGDALSNPSVIGSSVQNTVPKLKKDQRRPGRPVMGITVAFGPADQSWKYKVMVVVLSLEASE